MNGEQLKEQGMKAALDHAERKVIGWKERAIQCLIDYTDMNPGIRFQCEDVRNWAHNNGLEKPPHARAWGSVMAIAKKRGLILCIGYDSVDNPLAHCAPCGVWVRI